MKVKCLNCGYEFDLKNIYNDELGTHTVCPECNGSFDIDTMALCTFPDDDKDYCKYFEVPRDWLVGVLKKWNRRYVDLEEFLNNYVWDETWFVYGLAKETGMLITENEEA